MGEHEGSCGTAWYPGGASRGTVCGRRRRIASRNQGRRSEFPLGAPRSHRLAGPVYLASPWPRTRALEGPGSGDRNRSLASVVSFAENST